MITNFHTHTYRCLHAQGSELDYVKSAINQGVEILGFSDHGPFPDFDFGLRMQFCELKDYLSELDRLKSIYSEKIKIYKGLEIEYHRKYSSYYKSLKKDYGVEFLALGEHTFFASTGELKNIFFAQSTEDYIYYAKAVCEAIESGLFDYVAHPDIMFLNHFAYDDNCEKASNLIIDCAEKNNTIIEFNANGLRREEFSYPDGDRQPYPYIPFWKKVASRNIKVIVGSDCHAPSQVNDEFMKRARNMAKELNLNITDNIF